MSVIIFSCMGFNRGNSPGSNVTSLTEHNTVVLEVMTLMWDNLKLVYHKGHALELSCF